MGLGGLFEGKMMREVVCLPGCGLGHLVVVVGFVGFCWEVGGCHGGLFVQSCLEWE